MLVKYIKANEKFVVAKTRVEDHCAPHPSPITATPNKLQRDSVKNGKLSGSPSPAQPPPPTDIISSLHTEG